MADLLAVSWSGLPGLVLGWCSWCLFGVVVLGCLCGLCWVSWSRPGGFCLFWVWWFGCWFSVGYLLWVVWISLGLRLCVGLV